MARNRNPAVEESESARVEGEIVGEIKAMIGDGSTVY